LSERTPPVVLVTGAKDCGKTTLVVDLVRQLARPDRAIVALKRATAVDRVDQPGTDTERFAEAGATVVGLTWPGGTYVASGRAAGRGSPVAGASRFGDGAGQPLSERLGRQATLAELVGLALDFIRPRSPSDIVVLAEGFSDSPHPRIHVHSRPGHPVRAAAGPVLDTWSLEEGEGGVGRTSSRIARMIDGNLPLLTRWAGEVRSGKPGARLTVAAVLAGGRGRRLGGRDKWTISVAGRPQSERCLEVLGPLFDTVLVVGRAPGEGRAHGADPRRASSSFASIRALPDLVPGSGPLGGLLTALSASDGRHVLAFAGDMPLLSPAFILHLLFAAERYAGRFDVLLPRWSAEAVADCGRSGQTAAPARTAYAEPLHAVYGPRCRDHLQTLVPSTGGPAGLRMTEAMRGLEVVDIPETDIRLFGDPADLFLNLNAAEDLARAERILSTSLAGTTTHFPK